MKFGNHVDLGIMLKMFLTVFIQSEMKLILKRGENKSFLFIFYFFIFYVSNLGRELVYMFYLLLLHICYLLFIFLYFCTCVDVLF